MFFKFLTFVSILCIVHGSVNSDWESKLEGLKESLRVASGNGMSETAQIGAFDELVKSASTPKDRIVALDLIPDWFRNAKSIHVTFGLRGSLRYLVETSTSTEEQLKQIEVLGNLSGVLRDTTPTTEDEQNISSVRAMFGILWRPGRDIDICLRAVECSLRTDSFPWACKDSKTLVPLLTSFVEGNRAIRGNPKARAKAIFYLSQLADESHSDLVIKALDDAELAVPDVVQDVMAGYKNIAKQVSSFSQRLHLCEIFEAQIGNADSKVRLSVAEGLQFLAEKSEGIDERRRLRTALGRMVADDDRDVVLEVSDGFEYLAKKAKELEERNIIRGFVKILLQMYDDGKIDYGVVSAYRELVANSESSDERRILREVAPDFLIHINRLNYWSAPSVCKAFIEKATETEERLFMAQKLAQFYTAERGGYSDTSYDICNIFCDLANRVTTKQERQIVLEVLTRPHCWPLDASSLVIAEMYDTDCKAEVQTYVEQCMKQDNPNNFAVAILKHLAKKEQKGADLNWIKTIFINAIADKDREQSGSFWYIKEEIIKSSINLCANISDEAIRDAVEAEFDAVIQKREAERRAQYEAYVAQYGSFPGDD